jgi:GNAT superfamily N-acetyltransferase
MDSTARQTPDLEYGPLREGDERRISELITRMSTDGTHLRLRDKSPAYYRWMYRDNPAGAAIVHSARLGDRIVASFAIAPKIVEIDGERVVLGKTMDMFTDPQWQGHGLMRQCTDAVFEAARAAGIQGWYVTPSVNSYPIFSARWGYREEFSLGYRLRVVPPGPIGRRLRLPATATLEWVDRFDESADALWAEVSSGYRVALVRDAAYLTWRYADNPDDYDLLTLRDSGRLTGIAVLGRTIRRGVPVGEVMDLVHRREDARTREVLVRALSARAAERGCRLVQAWSVPGTRLDTELRRAGLRWRRGEVKFLLSPDFPGEAASDPDAWLLSQGDGNDV